MHSLVQFAKMWSAFREVFLNPMALTKIISGGQTGVDRGALDAALVAGFPCGGWCPSDRQSEDGEIPERYPLTPLPALLTARKWQRTQVRTEQSAVRSARHVGEQYRARTLKNVQDSDGTVILFSGTLSGGTLLTRMFCEREKTPLIALDAQQMTMLRAADVIVRFIEERELQLLNVAGPRLSGWLQGYRFALAAVAHVIARSPI